MKSTEIANSIFYIGVNDKDIDLFEGQYKVVEGISYNTYLIKDEKIVLFDTVDSRKSEEWLEKLQSELEGKKIDYLVISHLEPDHSSNIKVITEMYPEVTLIGNSKTFEMLNNFFDIKPDVKKLVVKEAETLDIGNHTLQFFMAPMVHWPEVMVTYEQKERIIFSADGFGKFGEVESANENKLFSEDFNLWVDEARRYYINIVGKYGMQVQALLKKLSALEINMICPLHGPIIRDNLYLYIDKYEIWSSYRYEKDGVLVAFASIYGNTAKAAYDIVELLKKEGISNVKVMDLARSDIHEAVARSFEYSKLILLGASYNMNVFPPMENFLNTLKAKNYQNRKVGIVENGSWAPSAGKCMKNILEQMKGIEIVEPMVTIKSSMKEENRISMLELLKNIIK